MHRLFLRTLVLAPLLLAPLALAGLATAQDVRFAVSFASMDGEPAVVADFASGDVKVLRVEVRNDSDAPLEPGATKLQVTVLTSRNTLAEAIETVYLVGPYDERRGERVDEIDSP